MSGHTPEPLSAEHHTELPWVFAEEVKPYPEIATVGRVGLFVFGVATPGYPGGDYRNVDCPDPAGGADAAYIVEACNAYPSLQAELAEAREALRSLNNSLWQDAISIKRRLTNDELYALWKTTQTALAKFDGGGV